MSLISFLQGSGYICGTMTLNSVMMMKIIFLSGTMTIKNERLKKLQQKKSSYPLLGTHQGGGIGVFLRMRKKRQKNFFLPSDMLRLKMY